MHRRRGGAIPERGRSGGGEAGAGEPFEPALVFRGEEGGGGVGSSQRKSDLLRGAGNGEERPASRHSRASWARSAAARQWDWER